MNVSARIGIIGEFNPDYRSHAATNEAIDHAGNAFGIAVEVHWLPTALLQKQTAVLERFDALWCSPGSPYQSMEGYRCSYSLNPAYREQIQRGTLKIVGCGDGGAVRAIELAKHRFFVATLFLPQMNSAVEKPHPIILRYLEEAQKFRRIKRKTKDREKEA